MCVCVIEQNARYCSKVIPRNDLTNKCHPHYAGLLESCFKDRPWKHKKFLDTRAIEMQRSCLTSYGTKRTKELTFHSNGVFYIKLNHIQQVQGIVIFA